MLTYVALLALAWGPWVLAMRARPTARTFWGGFRAWIRVVFGLNGFRVRAAGAPPGGPVVYVSNHQTMLDIAVLVLGIGAPFVFVARASLRRVPLVGSVLARSRCVFLDRSSRAGVAAAMAASAERLAAGESVLFFPEGSRTFGGPTTRFYPGAFRLAQAAGVPVVPVALGGTQRLFDERRKAAAPGRVGVRLGAPLRARPGESADAFAARARAAVDVLLGAAARPGQPAPPLRELPV